MTTIFRVTKLKSLWKDGKVRKVTQLGKDTYYCEDCWPKVLPILQMGVHEILWVEITVEDHTIYKCTQCKKWIPDA